jgi:DNA-binding transcriptional regulator YhcF (GntR family)
VPVRCQRLSSLNAVPDGCDVISQQALVGLESGEFPPGRKIPSESDIVQEAGVARSTARRAIALLRKEGVIFTVRDAGRTRQRATQAIGKPRRAKLGSGPFVTLR